MRPRNKWIGTALVGVMAFTSLEATIAYDLAPRVCITDISRAWPELVSGEQWDSRNPTHLPAAEEAIQAGSAMTRCLLASEHADPYSPIYDPARSRALFEAGASWFCLFKGAELAKIYALADTGFTDLDIAKSWVLAFGAYRAVDPTVDQVFVEPNPHRPKETDEFFKTVIDTVDIQDAIAVFKRDAETLSPAQMYAKGQELIAHGKGGDYERGSRYLYWAMKQCHRAAALSYSTHALACKIPVSPVHYGDVSFALQPFADQGDAEAALVIARHVIFSEVWHRLTYRRAFRLLKIAEGLGADIKDDLAALNRRYEAAK